MLGYVILRHSVVVYKDQMVQTIPVRIRLDGFEFAKSHRKLLRRNRPLFRLVVNKKIQITEEKNQLFLRHCARFESGNHYTHLSTFITDQSNHLPVEGYEMEVYDGDRLVACSYFHVGEIAFCGTYCFFDPEYSAYSLGNYTMYVEIEKAIEMGKQYYYSGYVHHLPSQFDYKLNFDQMEYFDWVLQEWRPRPRKTLSSRHP